MESLFGQLRTLAASGDEKDRLAILQGVDKLQLELQTPFESQNKFRLQYMAQFICIRISYELGIFQQLLIADRPLTVHELAYENGASVDLLRRILRHLAAVRVVAEVAKDKFAANNTSKVYGEPAWQGALGTFLGAPMFQALPGFLAKTNYRNPTSTASPAQEVIGTTDTFFGYVTKDPKMAERVTKVQSIMSLQTSDRWLDCFPMDRELADWDCSPDRVLFVELGGGMAEGRQCRDFREKTRHLKGKIVLQDLQSVLDHVRPIVGVEFVAQDFFTRQKIHGAKFYYLREVVHDWSEDKVVEILKNLIPALGPGSRILIDDLVLPDVGCSWDATGADIAIMLVGGAERSKGDWEQLVAKAGLSILGMHAYDPQSYKTVIIIG